MAVVSHTPYTGNTDCGRTNDYLCDGHGLATDRINRYISDGHGGHTICEGYNCPSDPKLATEYMETLRLNYERQHPTGEGRTKGSVTHEQIYVSPTEEDNVPAEERMEMMKELIERTPLRDFASIYVPHDNTPDKHGHISLCPFSVDGTHKLCMNNALLNTLRREMDYICVEHGYSIVENPELWADKEYKEWFFRIKEEGKVKIHPPKEKDMATYKQDRKRARTYSKSKETQATRAEEQAAFVKRMMSAYKPETAEYFYAHPFLRDPMRPDQELRITRYDQDGNRPSELDLAAISLFCFAYKSDQRLKQKNINGSEGLQSRMHGLANKAYNAHTLLNDLDIRTHEELVSHIKECGGDIAELKMDIKRQQTIIESGGDDEKRLARAEARLAKNRELLTERSAEYRHLKEAESVLHPAESRELWQEYVEQMFEKELIKKLEYADPKTIHTQMYQMGKAAGITKPDVDRLIAKANTASTKTTWVEYRQFMRIVFSQDDNEVVTAIYDRISDLYEELREMRQAARSMPILGPFTLLLALSVAIAAGVQDVITKREIQELKWEAEIQILYAKEARRDKIEKMKEAKAIYDTEVKDASEEEIAAARYRFYMRAAQIIDRMDIVEEIGTMSLDERIDDAVRRRLEEGPPQEEVFYDVIDDPCLLEW